MSSAVAKAKAEADDRMPDSDDEDEEEGVQSSTESVDSNASSSSKKKKKKVGIDRCRECPADCNGVSKLGPQKKKKAATADSSKANGIGDVAATPSPPSASGKEAEKRCG